jgi:predicted secreted protein
MVDEVSLTLPSRLNGIDSKGVCNLAVQDAGNAVNDYSSVNVVVVGARNSKVNTKTLDQVQDYWTCYFNQIGITNITEQSDLSGF